MGDDTVVQGNGGTGPRWLRRLVLAALAIGTMLAVRKIAIDKADAEFERRLMEADRARD
ncbi:MAG TPA: hypothetical protein VKZ55_06705 [Microthrixaceae bacterium]|nr:hypothetical protein [Microthrixaceae bacterium]